MGTKQVAKQKQRAATQHHQQAEADEWRRQHDDIAAKADALLSQGAALEQVDEAVDSAFEDKRREKELARERREAELARIEEDETKRRVDALCERAHRGARRNAERMEKERLAREQKLALEQALLEKKRLE